MGSVKLGRTGLVVEKQGFGCLPIQRISKAEAVELLHRAYDGGINYFDTLIYGNLGFIIEYSTGIIKPKTISILVLLFTHNVINLAICQYCIDENISRRI